MLNTDWSKFFDNVKEKVTTCVETNNYNILYSIENNTKSIVLIAGEVQSGKTNAILNLIKMAITKFDYDHVFFLSGINNNLKNQSTERLNKFFQDCPNIETTDDIDSYIEYKYKWSGKYVLSILKEDSNLYKISTFIYNEYSYFRNKKVLIIDDESDYASVNTKTKEEKTRINKLIMKMYEMLTLVNMVLITATPYANILNSKFRDGESIEKIFVLRSNDGYTGLSFFNSLPGFYETNYLKNELIKMRGNDNDKSIIYSIFKWFYQTYKFFQENEDEKSTLLIYCSNFKDDHQKYKNTVKDVIDNFCMYESLFINLLKNESEANIDLIISWIKNYINKIQIYCLNSDSDSNVIEINDDKMCIVIGGTMLSRGITYENLLVELFLYYSPDITCDTLLQRCRWFGYRTKNNRHQYMKLITIESLKNSLMEAEFYNDLLFKNSGNEIDFNETYNKLKEAEQKLNLKIVNRKKL